MTTTPRVARVLRKMPYNNVVTQYYIVEVAPGEWLETPAIDLMCIAFSAKAVKHQHERLDPKPFTASLDSMKSYQGMLGWVFL